MLCLEYIRISDRYSAIGKTQANKANYGLQLKSKLKLEVKPDPNLEFMLRLVDDLISIFSSIIRYVVCELG